MAIAQAVLTDAQRATLEALCDTFVPAVERDIARPGREGVHGAGGVRPRRRARRSRG